MFNWFNELLKIIFKKVNEESLNTCDFVSNSNSEGLFGHKFIQKESVFSKDFKNINSHGIEMKNICK